MKVIDRLVSSIRSAAVFNAEVQAAPACILWTDSERQWESITPRLREELPELLVLGDYAPEKRTGPAIWLRCAIVGEVKNLELPAGNVPIIYLPGVSRQDLRAVESCPELLKPIAELQYRGVIWSQINAKDWTALAFLKTDQGGLNLDVALDNETKTAALLALKRLLDEDAELLKGKRIDRDFFNALLTGGDPVRDLLQWINEEQKFKSARDANEWQAFVQLVRSQFNFDPQKEGILTAAANLAGREGVWSQVWERFCEAPARYPNIPAQIRKCQPPNDTLLWHDGNSDLFGGWAQWNEEQENKLRGELLNLQNITPQEARKKLVELEKQHAARRRLVWAELGEAPIALALKHLTALAENTAKNLVGRTIQELAERYAANGWQIDDAAMRALAEIEKSSDLEAVKAAVRSVYLPWLEDSARHLQQIVDAESYPGGTIEKAAQTDHSSGECVLFVDGLRFDAAKRLSGILAAKNLSVTEKPKWSALPSVTATGKPAVSPVRDQIRGLDNNVDFEPSVAETGQSLKGGYHLKKLLKNEQWEFLSKSDDGDGSGNAWCEFGDIDHEGHDRGWKLARHLDALLNEIAERIAGLIRAGWRQVCVVTDHGWLLLPGGLPKTELPSALTSSKWGRCAAIKSGAATDERLFPWFWNPAVHFALAGGISCFKAGEEYAHGGLSFQECLTLELVIMQENSRKSESVSVEIADIIWKGLRCNAALANAPSENIYADIRTEAGEAASSVLFSVKPFNKEGTVSVVVMDEDLEGEKAVFVLLDDADRLIGQREIRIGGE